VISTATDTVTATVAVGDVPVGVAITPDGSAVYVTNLLDGTISVISTATNEVTATISVGTRISGIAIAPDGRRRDGLRHWRQQLVRDQYRYEHGDRHDRRRPGPRRRCGFPGRDSSKSWGVFSLAGGLAAGAGGAGSGRCGGFRR
jgi:YVTN family beta-propeller protein